MRYPYVDIAGQHEPLKDEILEAVARVIDHGQFVAGGEVEAFEGEFARLCSTRCAVAVNSGTDALILALRGLGIGPGDEVITVPNSFVATTSAIRMALAEPVFVDVGEDYTMDADAVETAVTPRTRAILPVHLTGRPADMDPIGRVAREHGLAVVEDAAQAVLAEYRGQRVGSFGAAGCFSLHPLKTLSACGDGGIITTDDADLAESLRILRNLGQRGRDDVSCWSGNSRLDSLQAAILLVKMPHLESWTERRRQNAAAYFRALADLPEVQLPVQRPHEKPVYHTFVIQAQRRDELRDYVSRQGIGTAIHYPVPLHLHEAAAGMGHRRGSYPVTERQAEQILSLPIHQGLQPPDLDFIADQIKTFYHAG